MNHATVYADVTAEVSIGGVEERIEAMTLSNLRRDIIVRAAAQAERTGSPVELTIEDIDAVATLLVHPNGKVEETKPRQPRTAADARDEGDSGVATEVAASTRSASASPAEPAPADSTQSTVPPREPDSPEASAPAAPAPRAPISSVPRASDSPEPVSPPPAAPEPAAEQAPASAPWPQHSDAYPEMPPSLADTWAPGATPERTSAPNAPAAPAPASDQASAPAAAPTGAYSPGSLGSRANTSAASPNSAPRPATGQAAPQIPARDEQQGWQQTFSNPQTTNAPQPAAAEPRQSFLVQETVEEPASRGFRGVMSRMGMRMAPSAAERAERADEQAVSQHWPGPRTIAVVNGKGGAGKTPTTILLSAILARYGGAGVLAWDNNQTRGTLGWRTEKGPHDSTLHDLLPNVDRLLGTGAQSADLASFVHHQTRDRFDVLRSKPMELASAQRVTGDDVDAIHAVASKYYRLVVIDSGNDESDPLWLRMIDHTDQIVVATTTRDDHAEAGALLLDALRGRDERSARLAANAVAVVTQADPKESKQELKRVADGYGKFAREVVSIPHDPAMVDGLLRLGSLSAETQRAWLAAGAAVARGL